MAITAVRATTLVLLFQPLWLFSAPATSAEAEETIENIIVTGRRDSQPLEKLIGAIGQVTTSELELVGHQHIHQAAARLPGVWLSRGNGQELLAAVRSPVFTGAGSCGEVLTSEDGLPIRPTGLCNVNQLFEVNTEQASGLEVWRGPGTVFYGSNAIHG
ncbi:MAG: TonB-dependent receptor plug domain-containing protein, partial [Porticoccaceae bacterium]